MIIPHENDPITAIRSGSYYQVQYFAIIISFIRWSECLSASKTDGVVVADHELCVCPGQIYIIINTHNEPPLILHFFSISIIQQQYTLLLTTNMCIGAECPSAAMVIGHPSPRNMRLESGVGHLLRTQRYHSNCQPTRRI